MKKIMLLGGSAQQVIAIKKARQLGYETVVCDYLPDNPGQYEADKFYLASTTDRKKILDIAEREQIDGILAYASDPAAPIAAYVAELMGLPTNPYQSVETLCNKDMFRMFLKENGFNTPKSNGYDSIKSAVIDTKKYCLPVLIKPVDSSGSKGVTIVHAWNDVEKVLEKAFSFSKIGRIIIEEFIENRYPYLIGGDIFVLNGEIILWGLMNCHRDEDANPLVPVGKSYPVELSDSELCNAKSVLRQIVNKLHIRFGAMNVELVVDKNNRVWPIDIGPRNGGNMIPDLLSLIFHVDVVGMSIKVAMGEALSVNIGDGAPYYATHNIHSRRNGIFEGIIFSDELKPYIIKEFIYKCIGDKIEYFDNASKVLGIVFFRFPNKAEMKKMLSDINKHVIVRLRE